MKATFLQWPIFLLIASMLIISSCDKDDDDNTNTPSTSKTIAQTVESDARFTILKAALDRTSLTAVLDDNSANFTVFAPNDAAFQALLTSGGYADLDALEAALTTEGLKNVLLYHVLGAKVTSGMVTTGYVTTLAVNSDGDMLSLFANASSGVSLNDGSQVTDADIEASNGVIHEINKVLLPANVAQLVAYNTASYTSLTAALSAADGNLVSVLADESATFTVFAPDDNAFADLLQATNSANLSELVQNLGGTAVLRDVLLYHVTTGNVRAEDLQSGMIATAYAGNSITVNVGSTVTLTDGQGGISTVNSTNIQATNGVIHNISAVLVP